MKQYNHFFGVDVSKKTVDITYVCNDQAIYRQFSNDSDGMTKLMQWLKDLNNDVEQTLFCMEATGLYCFTITQFLAVNEIDTWIEHANQIKRSSSLDRGKNDKIDSKRIALYATKNLDRLRLWKPMNATLERIKHLASLRTRLVETQKKLITPIQEFEEVGNIAMSKLLTKTIKSSLASIDKDLKNLEKKIIEGKNKMSVLNAVKNKLLARVIAVVNKQQEYVKKLV